MARVLLTGFCAVPGPTRAGVQIRHVVRALASHTVDLLVVRDGDQPYVERQGSGRLLRVPTHDADLRGQVQAYQRALRRQLEGADYDVVHCQDAWGAAPVLEARDRFGYAVVFDLARGASDDRSGMDAELAAQLDRDEEACLLAADLVLVPTEPARRYAVTRGQPERVVLSPPGVDVDRFDWDDGAVRGPPVLLYVGAIGPGRGVRTLLRAMVDVARATTARLVMVGPVVPGFDALARQAIAELGLGQRVELRPPIEHDQMPALIAGAALCVVPSAAELVPRPYALYPTRLLEYMACRRAVVAPRRGTVGMLVDHGREGLLFQPGDHVDLGRKLVRLVDDANLRDRLAGNGYDRVRREFTASAARRAVRNAYAELAERPEWRHRFAEVTTGSHDLAPAGAVGDPIAADGGDDEFEATVYEAAPTASDAGEGVDASLDVDVDVSIDASEVAIELGSAVSAHDHTRATTDDSADLDAALSTLDADLRSDGHTDERALPPTDETQERVVDTGESAIPTRLSPFETGSRSIHTRATSDADADGTSDGESSVRRARGRGGRRRTARTEEWVVRHPGRKRRRPADDGTPIDTTAAPATGSLEAGTFVAGEIDVPTPTPELLELLDDDAAFTAAAHLLGSKEPDTGA